MARGLVGDFVTACGKGPLAFAAGALLHRMTYLHDLSTVVIDEQRWYIRSRDELMGDLGLTRHMYATALKLLQDLGFVEIVYTQSLTKKAALRTTAFRVTEKARVAILKITEADIVQPTGEQDGLSTGQQNVLSTGKQTRLSTKEVDIGNRYGGRHSAWKNTRELPDRVKPKHVEEVYREGVKAFDASYYHVPWTMREKGMAGNLIKKLGEAKVLDVVRACTADWPGFVEEAAKSSVGRIAEKPNLASLLLHASAAVQFAGKNKPVSKKGAKKSVKELYSL